MSSPGAAPLAGPEGAAAVIGAPSGRLLLAPMEGLADAILRDLLTGLGGYDGAVTEFVRVSAGLLPRRVFRRACPELAAGGRTAAGTPVTVQLLGADAASLAENAARLAELGPPAIDLNFGCPSRRVNLHGGGAVLLDDPERLRAIASAVRAAVPRAIPITAKMRLGVRAPERCLECAQALEAGGVAALVVHARVLADGYRPPARWEWVARVRAAVGVPVIANGEVWDLASYDRCRQVTGCGDVMLGRGAIADPFLARRIAARLRAGDADASDGPPADRREDWGALRPVLGAFWARARATFAPEHAPGRLKQWLEHLARTFPAAAALHAAVRPLRAPDAIAAALAAAGVREPR